MDDLLAKSINIRAHKLCGAGGGGYFLVISDKNTQIKLDKIYPYIRIKIDNKGLSSISF